MTHFLLRVRPFVGAAAAVVLALVSGCKSREDDKASPVTRSDRASRDAGVADAAADGAMVEDLATALTRLREELALPALGVGAWRDGTLVELGAVGHRKLGADAGVTAEDKWHLGSNTKAMTALLIGVFVDRGVVRWTDTIGQRFPGWRIDAGYRAVTLDQLLRHTGGAPEEPPSDVWKRLWSDGDAPGARETFVRSIIAKPPAQKPGTHAYSNAGYMIAGLMLERATGKGWEQLMRDELFGKLGMASCGFGPPGSAAVDQPWGHDGKDRSFAPGPSADNPRGLGPAGTVHCSLADYGTFLNVFATGSPALVSPETMTHLTTATDGDYACGWNVITTPKGNLLAHSGSNTMWFASAIVVPATKVAIVVVTNKGDPDLENALKPLLQRVRRK